MTTTNQYPWGHYAELRPNELEAIIERVPVAYLPWGALEWHGPHLPFGVDGFTAEALIDQVSQRTGGVVLPTTWWPITALPHRLSLSIPSAVVQALWEAIFAELARAGFRVIVVVTGHYAQGHELVLMDAAEAAMTQHGLVVLAVPPLALVDERMLDHAAHWETALMLALRPKLVALNTLREGPTTLIDTAVLGDDPRGATLTQGESALALAAGQLTTAVRALLSGNNGQDSLRELYARRRARYQSYVDTYFRGSWEAAIDVWWKEKTD
ncbi:MAG: creatininase family protein [Roseiflexaceae bacterium]|nr:creatininase family protein [Roseiflexaceae bacterium]